MIGYHYTSKENALKIQKEGFKPLLILKEELMEYFPKGVMGTWLWQNKLTPEEHLHTVLFQYCTRKSPDIVLFEVQFDGRDALYYGEQRVELSHVPILIDYRLDTSPKSVICTKPIPPEDVRLIKEFDLIKLLS